jgi:O-antigen ligase
MSGVNFIVNEPNELYTPSFFPQFILLPLTLFIATQFNKQDARVLTFMVAFEVGIAVLEYFAGVSTFFTGLKNYETFADSELMYFHRPLGLSANSSILAVKCLLALLLIDFFNRYQSLIDKALWLILLVGVYLTFGRTVFLSLLVFFGFKTYHWYKSKKSAVVWFYAVFGAVIVFVFAVDFLIEHQETLVNQLTRNTKKVDLSGREKVWPFYLMFIKENLWFGNGSYKIWFGLYHAHNSFLQIIATNGIVISLLYFGLIATFINTKNLVYILTILVYSIFQYAIFWGVSITDIIFFFFLLESKNREGV